MLYVLSWNAASSSIQFLYLNFILSPLQHADEPDEPSDLEDAHTSDKHKQKTSKSKPVGKKK